MRINSKRAFPLCPTNQEVYNMKKFTYRAIMLAMTLFLLQSAAAAQTKLPDIQGWSAGEARETKLETVSGYQGTWIERDYRTVSGVPFHAVWIDGSGPKGWTTGKRNITANDGAIGSGAQYKTLSAAGYEAILETHPITGLALSVRMKEGVLTLESLIASEEEAIAAAEAIINNIK